MTIRKTFSLPDDVARALERAARAEGKAESAVVREALESYLVARNTSKLHLWVGKGRAVRGPAEDETYERTLDEALDRKYKKGLDRPERGS
ncbi:MAG: ribbon-helix-helix protein, CopG family [Actinomycetota bacterium]